MRPPARAQTRGYEQQPRTRAGFDGGVHGAGACGLAASLPSTPREPFHTRQPLGTRARGPAACPAVRSRAIAALGQARTDPSNSRSSMTMTRPFWRGGVTAIPGWAMNDATLPMARIDIVVVTMARVRARATASAEMAGSRVIGKTHCSRRRVPGPRWRPCCDGSLQPAAVAAEQQHQGGGRGGCCARARATPARIPGSVRLRPPRVPAPDAIASTAGISHRPSGRRHHHDRLAQPAQLRQSLRRAGLSDAMTRSGRRAGDTSTAKAR